MMADAQSRKPIPAGEQQIEHLKQKGVFFVLYTEMEAARIRDLELFNPTQPASPLSRSCGAPAITARATMRTSEMKTQSPSGSRGRAGVRISNLPPWLSLLCMVIYIKEESTMQISVSSTLIVFHDGQFWVGLAEHVEDGRYGVARIVFGAEPSDEEILQFVRSKWAKLAFFGDDPAEGSKPAKNPKRRAREVSKVLKQPAMGTKAQQALASQRETMKRELVRARSQRRADEAEARFEQRKLRRKQKHRGH
ncbi:YjdF family protein [Slackia exigua]|nr:YjdF family protein [Slackia exigua]